MESIIHNCDMCGYKTDNIIMFNNHINIIHNKKSFKSINNSFNYCLKCGKILATKYSLEKHIIICKGVLNPFECHICHKILASYSSKCHHLKKCNVNYYNHTNKSSLAYINEENKIINLDINHLNDDLLKILSSKDENEAFLYFCKKIFENKNNRLIIKKDVDKKWSDVHIGMNKWSKCLDSYIYPKILSNIANIMFSFIEERKNTIPGFNFTSHISFINVMIIANNTIKRKIKNNNIYKENIKIMGFLFNSYIDE